VADWKQYGHKHECQADTLTDRRAVFATVTIDLLRLLGQHALFTNEEEAAQLLRSQFRFITTVCLLKFEAAPVPVGSVRLLHTAFVLSQSHNIWSVTNGVRSILQMLVEEWMNGAERLFRHGREDLSEVHGKGTNPNVPQGLPGAAERAAKDIESHLLALPKGASFRERFEYASRKVSEECSGNSWRGAMRNRTPEIVASNLQTNTEQSSLYDKNFLGGATDCYEYPVEKIPVGSVITVFHFAMDGVFYKRIDYLACRKGLVPDRVISANVKLVGSVKAITMDDCRAMQKLEQTGIPDPKRPISYTISDSDAPLPVPPGSSVVSLHETVMTTQQKRRLKHVKGRHAVYNTQAAEPIVSDKVTVDLSTSDPP